MLNSNIWVNVRNTLTNLETKKTNKNRENEKIVADTYEYCKV